MNRHTPGQRRFNMQPIRSKDTEIAMSLRQELWSRGLRYRKNCKNLPGTPDIVFIKAKIAVFCDSEFWHGFDWENRKNCIGTNQDFCIHKIERNIERDAEVNKELNELGYTVIRFWGKQIESDVCECADKVENFIKPNKNIMIKIKVLPENRIGGDERITPYSEWERNKPTRCIYCDGPADTREHVPSKAFLDDVLPEYIPTLPSCSECNNGFSADEMYVACSIDYLKSCVFPEHVPKKKTTERLEKNKQLAERLKKQFCSNEESGIIDLSEDDINRFERIMIKLAIGHAHYQNDYLGPYGNPPKIACCFIFQFDQNSYDVFNSSPKMTIIPEIGSRGSQKIGIIRDDKGNDNAYYFWNELQPDHYRYLVYNDKNGTHVRIVINEFFFCSVFLS